MKYDERGRNFEPVNKATFLNEIAKMLRVYQEATGRTEEYQYDAAGNRRLLKVTLVQTAEFESEYYTNTDRLKTDGRYAFKYDAAGNMIEKGNQFTINGDTVTFITTGEGVEYWQYQYDLLNRLIKVTKNGNMVAEYAYDPEGLRVVKRAKGETTHYVFQGTEPIFEKRIAAGKSKSYVYALGKYLARVDGVIGEPEAKKYFYHTDHVGSIRVITDQAGQIVFNADYLAFGAQFGEDNDFEELHGFTGKEFDPDIGLYYFNARWYDPDLGRFISEDPVANPNLYIYGNNNPLSYIDPDGRNPFLVAVIIGAIVGGIDAYCNGGDFLTGAFVGAVGGAVSYGLGTVFGTSTVFSRALTAGMSSGIMSEALGGDFGDGFRTGFISGGVSAYLGSKTSYTGDMFLDRVKTLFNGAFGEFVATGKYTFNAGDALALCGATDAISEALSVALNPPAMDGVGNAEDDSYQQLTSALEQCDVQITLLELQLENPSLTPEQRELINQKIDEWLEFKVRIKNSLPKFIWPTTGVITSPYDPNREPITLPDGTVVPGGHRALDIANVIGTPVVAMADGIITGSRWSDGSGWILDIDYGNGFSSSYHHLREQSSLTVGTRVSQGQVVAYMGATGRYKTGPHLHLSLKFNGQLVNPVDYLPERK